jgi:DNA cross-link repair 1A protein
MLQAVAQALGTTIYCDPRKRGILLCQTDPELHALLSTDPISSHVHLLPLGNIQLDRMQEYLVRLHPHFDRVLGFRPTGWTYSPPAGTDMMPDINNVIRRDQGRWFTDASLKPMRGSCRQYMMYGKYCPTFQLMLDDGMRRQVLRTGDVRGAMCRGRELIANRSAIL